MTTKFSTANVDGKQVQVIERWRKHKERNGMTDGPTFRGFHSGKYSVYVAKHTTERPFHSPIQIRDVYGNEAISPLNK